MRLPTVKIRNKRSGRTMKINARTWAEDLGTGRLNGWERVGGETRGDIDEKPAVERPVDTPAPFEIQAEAETTVSESNTEAPAPTEPLEAPDPLPEGISAGPVVRKKRKYTRRKV